MAGFTEPPKTTDPIEILRYFQQKSNRPKSEQTGIASKPDTGDKTDSVMQFFADWWTDSEEKVAKAREELAPDMQELARRSSEEAALFRMEESFTESLPTPAFEMRIGEAGTLPMSDEVTVEELEDEEVTPIPADTADGVQSSSGKATRQGLMSPATDRSSDSDFVGTALNKILKSEGGFQDDAEDTGNYRPDGTLVGTNRGITPNALASYRGVDPNSITVADMKGVTEEEARNIYRKDYFERPKIDQLPSELQETVFDMYINAGGNAIKILQRKAGLTGDDVDGILGSKALKAIEDAGITKSDYADARIEYYTKVAEADPDKAKYLKGWTARANKYRD